ncbi:MAG: hypothetical protein A2W37_03725 [Chloroflexi bacterium RBG_16_63_12]|nr:MAG: hypothetical protein A2W37_03725 [Chloroflexi bacterium RBG_16_63_12]
MTYIRLDLRPLSEADSRRLVAEILRKVPEIPPALTDMIVSRAEGNSFYVEELIKMLIEDKVIVTGEDLWRVEMERLAQVRVPATLTGVLQSRLDGLPPLEREKLQQASVVGRVFWENVVERLHNPESEAVEPSAAVSEKLNNLSHKELIFRRDTSAFAEAQEYIFKHAILRDVTYESVLKRLRRIYHAQVAECLIELSGERAGEYAGRIGEHYERAGEWARAAEWYAQAGKQAQETYAPETAIGYYRKALDFWKQESNAQSLPTGLQLEVYRGLGSQLMYQAHYAEAIETYTAMRAAAEAIGDTAAQARAWYGVSEVQSKHGDHHIALENATQAEAVARVAGAQIELTDALWMKGRCLFRLGDAEAALALGEQMLALSTEIQAQRQMAKSLNLLGAVHYIAGRYLLAAASFTQALAICRELGDRGQAESLLNNLGVIAEARGDYRGAFEHYQEALNIAREIGDRDAELVFLSNLGAAGVRLGDYPSAEAYLRQVIRMAGDTGASVLSDSYSYLAETCLGQGKVEEALSAARRALTLGQEAGVQESIAAAWRALGSAAARSPEPVSIVEKAEAPLQHYSAVECFAESLRICTEKGMEGERAKTLRAWARYELEQGDHEKGAAMWQEARETFARLGAELEVERMATLPARSSS